jgi:RNA polymerase sigma factor (sigma-70 family)
MPPGPSEISTALNAERDAFRAFVASRVGSEADAEDILQNGLVRALKHAGNIDPGKATAWFYRLLRNAIVDHYRQRASDERRKGGLGATLAALGEDVTAAPEWERRICSCMDGVLDTMPPKQAQLLRLVDLEGSTVGDAAEKLQISANSASVTLHRARKELRARLERFCGACASGACLDCDCQPADDRAR